MSDANPDKDRVYVKRIDAIVKEALGIPKADRAGFVRRLCGDDAGLLDQVESLIRNADVLAATTLEAPADDGPLHQLVRPLHPLVPAIVAEAKGLESDIGSRETFESQIGRYRLIKVLGKGTFGTVFLADQLEGVRQQVALKRLNPGMNSEHVVSRFELEREALAAMNHPNIAKVFDGGKTPSGYPFFVMEFVDGVPLTTYCDANALDAFQRIELFVQACKGVQHAHTKGIIHRDLKPLNILVADYDGVPIVKVIDFGIAKAVGEPLEDRAQFTTLGAIVGTLPYMSPEQASFNALDLDVRTDVYALGAVLYELLTGISPLAEWLTADTALDALLRVIRERVPPTPSSRRISASSAGRLKEEQRLAKASTVISCEATPTPHAELERVPAQNMHGDLDWIVMKALEKERDRRYDSAQDLARDIALFLDGRPVLARPPTITYRLSKFVRRHRFAVAAVTLLSLAISAGVFGTMRGLMRARTESLKAQASTQLKSFEQYASDFRGVSALWSESRVDLIAERLSRHVPVAAEDGDLRGFEWYYWNRMVHAAIATLHADGRVTSLAWSVDGLKLWSTDVSGRLLQWDLESTKRTELVGADNGVTLVAVDPSGKHLAYVESDAGPSRESMRVKIIDLSTRSSLSSFSVQRSPISCIAFSHDGSRLAIGDVTGEVDVWDVASARHVLCLTNNAHSRRQPTINPLRRLDKHNGPVTDLSFSVDASRVVSVDAAGGLAVWDSGSGVCLKRQNQIARGGLISSIAFSADGSRLVARQLTTVAHMSESQKLGEIVQLDSGADALIAEFGLADDVPARRPATSSNRPVLGEVQAAFADDDQHVITAVGNILRIYDRASGAIVGERKGHASRIVNVRVSPNSEVVATADETGDISIWNLRVEAALSTELTLPSPARGLARLADSRRAVLRDAGADRLSSGAVRLSESTRISLYKGETLLVDSDDSSAYAAVAATRDNRIFAAAFGGNLVELDPSTLAVTRTISTIGDSQRIRAIACRTEDEVFVVCGTSVQRARPTNRTFEVVPQINAGPEPSYSLERLTIDRDTVVSLAFSDDGSRMASGTASGAVIVRAAPNWDVVARLNGHRREVTALCFSSDGRRLASCSGRFVSAGLSEPNDVPGEIVVWDTVTWRDCLTLSLPGGYEFSGLAFDEGDRTILATANSIVTDRKRTPASKLFAWKTAERKTSFATLMIDKAGAKSHDRLTGRTLLFPSMAIARGPIAGFTSLAIHPSGDFVAAVDVRGTLVLWDCRSGDIVKTASLPDSSSWAIDFIDGGKTIYCSTDPFGRDSAFMRVPDLAVRPAESAAVLPTADAMRSPTMSSPNGLWSLEVSVADHTEQIYVRDSNTQKRSAAAHAVEPMLRQIRFFPDGEHFATIGGQSEVHIWSVKVPAPMSTH